MPSLVRIAVLVAVIGSTVVAAAANDIRPGGLVAVFPNHVACPEIASPFGSATRYDGSRRPMDRFGGLHGGIDISLAQGTPLLAVAAGKVIAAGTGAMFTGHYLWLQHAPEDTGLPSWIYTKYQHLRETSALAVGTQVKLGDVVGVSGNSGTAGRHYGPVGYPHLHLTVFVGPSARFEVRDTAVVAEDARIVDPVAIYHAPRAADATRVAIPALIDGAVHPAGARVIWPVACTRR